MCQEKRSEPLQCPAESKRPDSGAGYRSLGSNLQEFSELGEMDESVDLGRFNEGEGIVATLSEFESSLQTRTIMSKIIVHRRS